MAQIARETRRRRPAPRGASRLPLRAMLLHCPVARGGEDAPNLLRVHLGARGEALVVFSSRETAREALASEVFPSGCDTRVCSGGELVSLLFGPYRDVGWVLFDPPPGRPEEVADETIRISRKRFVDHLLGSSMPRTR